MTGMVSPNQIDPRDINAAGQVVLRNDQGQMKASTCLETFRNIQSLSSDYDDVALKFIQWCKNPGRFFADGSSAKSDAMRLGLLYAGQPTETARKVAIAMQSDVHGMIVHPWVKN